MAMRSMRLFSRRPCIKTLSTVLQTYRGKSSTKFVSSAQGDLSESNNTGFDLTHDIVHCHEVEQPIKYSMRTFDGHENLIPSNVHQQACQFANVLTGTEFNLSSPNTVGHTFSKFILFRDKHLASYHRSWLSYLIQLKNALYSNKHVCKVV